MNDQHLTVEEDPVRAVPLVIAARGIKYLRASVEVDTDALRAGIRRSI